MPSKSEMGMEENQNAWMWGPGATHPMVSNSHSQNTLNCALVSGFLPEEQTRQLPWIWTVFFSKSKVWKTPLPGTLSSLKHPLTNYSYCALTSKAFFQRNKPDLDKDQYPKTLYC